MGIGEELFETEPVMYRIIESPSAGAGRKIGIWPTVSLPPSSGGREAIGCL
jgi:hypothetical protein